MTGKTHIPHSQTTPMATVSMLSAEAAHTRPRARTSRINSSVKTRSEPRPRSRQLSLPPSDAKYWFPVGWMPRGWDAPMVAESDGSMRRRFTRFRSIFVEDKDIEDGAPYCVTRYDYVNGVVKLSVFDFEQWKFKRKHPQKLETLPRKPLSSEVLSGDISAKGPWLLEFAEFAKR